MGVVVQVGDREGDDFAEELGPQTIDYPLGQPGREETLQQRCRTMDQVGQQHQAENTGNLAERTSHKAVNGTAL